MGLGKTVQALAHIAAPRSRPAGSIEPCLVVCPTSLVANWRRGRALRARPARAGPARRRARANCFDEIAHARPGAHHLRAAPARHRRCCASRVARWSCSTRRRRSRTRQPSRRSAPALLDAAHRLCLTGTPMENHLGELWSLFDFLMPGCSATRDASRRVFRNADREATATPRASSAAAPPLRPFLLRRTKEQVAPELPPKTEIVAPGRARRAASATSTRACACRCTSGCATRSQQRGLARSHIAILEALLKLRQVCCDPRLLKPRRRARNVSSAKFELLMEHAAAAWSRRAGSVLVFSQFVSMLDLIEAGLAERGDPVRRSSPAQTKDRADAGRAASRTARCRVFLISLKAGGTGLKLTAADTVIHYDPWWNPAVEDQATDRAHRIGQDKPVFVYKLVAEGTVEEKMLELQGKKQALVNSVLSGHRRRPQLHRGRHRGPVRPAAGIAARAAAVSGLPLRLLPGPVRAAVEHGLHRRPAGHAARRAHDLPGVALCADRGLPDGCGPAVARGLAEPPGRMGPPGRGRPADAWRLSRWRLRRDPARAGGRPVGVDRQSAAAAGGGRGPVPPGRARRGPPLAGARPGPARRCPGPVRQARPRRRQLLGGGGLPGALAASPPGRSTRSASASGRTCAPAT